MKVLTDCPVVLKEWKLGDRGAERLRHPPPVWDAFGADADAWTLDVDGDPDVVLVLIGRSRDSQFDRLVELTRSLTELPDTLICVALEGDNFHGQAARPWTAVRGNLHLSYYSRLGIPAAELLEEIAVLPTLALLEAFDIEANPAEHTGIRWLNDLFIKGRKVAGTIAATQVKGDRIESVVYGIGVNVEIVPDLQPNPWVPAAASLRSTMPDAGWTVSKATTALIGTLGRYLNDLRHGVGKQFMKAYARHSACIGQHVRIWSRKVEEYGDAAPIAVGRLMAIHGDLSLSIQGVDELVREGRLAFEEDCLELGLYPTDF